MKKSIQELLKKSSADLDKEVKQLKTEIAKMVVERKVLPQKDTNLMGKKKNRVAALMTIINQKRESENLKGKKS